MDDVMDFFLDDKLIPVVFLTDYMPELGNTALRVYLMSLLYGDRKRKVPGKEVAARLEIGEEDFKAAVCELAGQQLVATTGNLWNYQLLDLKKQTVEKYYRRKTSDTMVNAAARTKANKEREQMIRAVNDMHFHGLMGAKWYLTIDNWFELYDFDPGVVYAMFQDAADRDLLKGPNYLDAVARDYHKNGVKNFDDLKRYKENYSKLREICRRIGKTLNKTMTNYDEMIVRKWVTEYGYDYPIIEVALRNAVRLAEPNMNYFDKILTDWHKAGIRSKEEAEQVELNRRRQAASRAKGRKHKAKAEADYQKHNFTDDDLAAFYGFAAEDGGDRAEDRSEKRKNGPEA